MAPPPRPGRTAEEEASRYRAQLKLNKFRKRKICGVYVYRYSCMGGNGVVFPPSQGEVHKLHKDSGWAMHIQCDSGDKLTTYTSPNQKRDWPMAYKSIVNSDYPLPITHTTEEFDGLPRSQQGLLKYAKLPIELLESNIVQAVLRKQDALLRKAEAAAPGTSGSFKPIIKSPVQNTARKTIPQNMVEDIEQAVMRLVQEKLRLFNDATNPSAQQRSQETVVGGNNIPVPVPQDNPYLSQTLQQQAPDVPTTSNSVDVTMAMDTTSSDDESYAGEEIDLDDLENLAELEDHFNDSEADQGIGSEAGQDIHNSEADQDQGPAQGLHRSIHSFSGGGLCVSIPSKR